MKNVLKSLAKDVLIPLELTAAASSTDAAIHKKMFGFATRPSDLAKQTTLIIFNEEINDVMKIAKSFEEFGLLIKCVSEAIKNKELGASLLGKLLRGTGTIRAGEGTIKAGQDL